jgi:hypothetical protein
MRFHHHDFRDMGQAFSLGFDLRRVLLMATAASWTVAVLGLYFVLISWRISGFTFDKALSAEQILQSWRVLTDTRASADRVLLWLSILGMWWLGFARLITPVGRSLALEIARDERLDQKGMAVASHRLSGLVTGAPVISLFLFALIYLCVLLWALLAKIPGEVGAALATLILPFALIAALVGAAVLLVAIISLPLMTPAAVIECRDLMDVVSRATAYVLQRPLRYLWGMCVKFAMTLGAAIVGATLLLSAWGLVYLALVIVGEGDLALSAYHLARRSGGIALGHSLGAICFTVMFYSSVLVAVGWLMTVSMACDLILYMVLRYEVDGVTFDEILIPQEHIKLHALTAEDTKNQALAAQEAAKAAAQA